MHYKTNRQNHDFQILHFIVKGCHTPDGAYAILTDLEEDRHNAIKTHTASKLREQAKRLAAEEKIGGKHLNPLTKLLRPAKAEADRLEGEADLAEIAAMEETTQRCYDAALDELAFIRLCKEKLEPHRKYAHLPLPRANQAAQPEEWKFELMKRAENYLLSGNGIPADHFGTMRMHPEFETAIRPHITAIIQAGEQARIKGADNVQLPQITTPLMETLREVKLDSLLLLE